MSPVISMKITHALKEWAIAVDALEEGKTILLLRKGGIQEEGNRFKVAHHQVLLYPTYEHQQPDLLKPGYASGVKPVPSGWHPETILISAWAEITNILLVSDEPVVTALLPYHVWSEQFVSDRLKWKPRVPIYLLLLRTYRLAQSQSISYRLEYGGCRSWITLAAAVSLQGSIPVLSDAEYTQQVNAIYEIVGE
jgi:hypothetical protein